MKIIKILLSLLAFSSLPIMAMDNGGKRQAPALAAPAPKRQNARAAAELLREGVAQADFDKFNRAIAEGANPLFHGKYEMPLIDLAICKKITAQKSAPDAERDNRYDDIIQYLLQLGAKPNPIVQIDFGHQLLLSFVGKHHNNTRLLRLLLETDINPNQQLGQTAWIPELNALSAVVHSDSPTNPCNENLKALLEYGADPNPIFNGDPNYFLSVYPLCRAAAKGNIEAVKLLLASGADINKVGGTHYVDFPSTALGCAIQSNNEALVKLLLENGANTEYIARFNGEYYLAHAALNGQLANVQLLLQYGATPNIHCGNKPLLSVIAEKIKQEMASGKSEESANFKITLLLFLFGTKIQNTQNKTFSEADFLSKILYPIVHAAAYASTIELQHCIDTAKKKGEDVAVRLDEALKWAASKRNIDTIRYLLEHGAHPQKAVCLIVPFLIRDNNIGVSAYTPIFKQLADALPPCPDSSAMMGELMASTLKLHNIELMRLFLVYNPTIMPSLCYLDNALLRPLQPGERIILTNMRNLLIPRAPLYEQIIRRPGQVNDLLTTNIRQIPGAELRARIIAQLRRDTLTQRRIQQENRS